jgi:hypothetical protein
MLALALIAAPASANLLQDGGFEMGPLNPDGWTGPIDYDRPEAGPGGPAEGEHYAGMQTGGATGQTIAMTCTSIVVDPSTLVTLTGYWHVAGPFVEGLIQLIDGSSSNDTVIGQAGPVAGIPGWAPFELAGHIATGHVKIKVQYRITGGWNTGSAICVDGLNLTPEPSSLALLGLAGLPLLRRRR